MATDYYCSRYSGGQISTTPRQSRTSGGHASLTSRLSRAPVGETSPIAPHSRTLWNNLLFRVVAISIFVTLTQIQFSSGEECSGQFRCGNGQCIQMGWECDNEYDCIDQSDEDDKLCGNKTCSKDHFSCGTGLPCVPESWRCDSAEDCVNGVDELNCNHTCKVGEFQCNDTLRCITGRWKCDHDQDCTDGSDERNCPEDECNEEQFRCANRRCIPPAWKCDGDNDCVDHSDELECNATQGPDKQCPPYDFSCVGDGVCINRRWMCDGDKDCHDGSDEFGCTNVTCGTAEFQCHNRSCIELIKRCDQVPDCLDGSDEIDCNSVVPIICDTVTEFDCSDVNVTRCINLTSVCDGLPDCSSGADENKDYCSKIEILCPDGLNCSDKCHNISGQPQCKCGLGYQLAKDNRTCEDIDECSAYVELCSQECVNTIGSYKCMCHEDYEKDPIDQSCKAKGEEPKLLFANRHDLREVGLHSSHYQAVVEELHSAIALDYDYRENFIYWSDVASESITRRQINASSEIKHTILVKTDLSTPDGLALDWIHKNLYWTDTGSNRIEVQNVDKITYSWRRVLISDGLDEPRAIVVDPRNDQRFMYWTDWGDTPKIEKSNLDGSGRRVILGSETNQSPGLVWPNGLTIDYDSNRLFWVDAKLHLIGSSNLEGGQRQIVFTSFNYLKHPFALTVFEDDIYWSDWEAMSILRVSKHNGNRNNNTVKHIADHLYSPMDVHVYHILKQPTADNVCSDSPCDHLCFPTREAPFYTCNCSQWGGVYQLQGDGKSCKDITPPTTTTQFIPPPSTSQPSASSTEGGESFPPHQQPSSSAIEGQEGTGPTRGPESLASTNGANVSSVLIGLAVVLFAAAMIIVIVYYRYFRVRAPNGLNFDNPVYRRTTEDDQFCIERSTSYLQPKALSALLEPLNSDRV